MNERLAATIPADTRPAVASLDEAVPEQQPAKSVLRTEFSVFLAQRDKEALLARPVLVWGNRPGRMPAALVRGLAEEAGLPWIEVAAGGGIFPDDIVSQLARRAPRCREHHPLGVALISDVQMLSPAAARSLAAQLAGPSPVPHLHLGRPLNLTRRQVFWVVTVCVPEPERARARTEAEGRASPFALLAVGPDSADVVAAGLAGSFRGPSVAESLPDLVEALGEAFPANAWLLPGTREDLVNWARAEDSPWWPGRRMRAYCRHHGVALRLADGAVEAWAAEALREGGTVDALEDCLRLAMDPVLAAIADRSREWEAVELTPGSLAQSEAPRLVPGSRAPIGKRQGGQDSEAGESRDERPPRTPQSSPEVHLARAEDLAGLLEGSSEGASHGKEFCGKEFSGEARS